MTREVVRGKVVIMLIAGVSDERGTDVVTATVAVQAFIYILRF